MYGGTDVSGASTDLHGGIESSATSWVESANLGEGDFPLQNLPFGVYRLPGESSGRPATAIGEYVLDLLAARQAGLLTGTAASALDGCEQGELNALMQRGAPGRQALRLALARLLAQGSADQAAARACLHTRAAVEMLLPGRIGDYTDFYTGIHHATAVGKLFRPDQPLLPNYKWLPIGYHGRASSVCVSGQSVRRPRGQLKGAGEGAPHFAPCRRLDYELELGVLVGPGNVAGDAIDITRATDHLFGMVLLNDWSARDIQAWEYQPLGPFLGKSFATSISPWIVTPEALEPYRVAFTRPLTDPQPLPYLDCADNRAHGSLAITLEVWLQSARMRAAGQPHEQLMASNFRDSYWTVAQLLAHHTSNGCNLQAGDLLGSGTQSGPDPEQGGSLLELSAGGQHALTLSNGETRIFLEDGDRVC